MGEESYSVPANDHRSRSKYTDPMIIYRRDQLLKIEERRITHFIAIVQLNSIVEVYSFLLFIKT